MNIAEQKKRRSLLNSRKFPSEMWAIKILQRQHLFGFRRNVCVNGRYFGDFVWRSKKLVLEIDGKDHQRPKKIKYDLRRDSWLESHGWKVIRANAFDSDSLLKAIEKIDSHFDQFRQARKERIKVLKT